MTTTLTSTDIEHATRWQAVCTRDAASDGTFVYAVRTTGIYCRPTCPSRRPNRANVAFFDTPARAAAAGFRACKKCDPARDHQPLPESIQRVCAYINAVEHHPSLPEMADIAGCSLSALHRNFKRTLGLTPRAYAATIRATRLQAALPHHTRVADAVFAAGFESGSRAYATADAVLGMTPATYAAGGAGEVIAWTIVPCALGFVGIAATAKGIAAIELGDAADQLQTLFATRFPRATLAPADPAFTDWVAQVVMLIDQPARPHAIPLDIRGTVFQRRVWEALRAIPPGLPLTYGALAQQLGAPTAVRAVATACAANPVAVAIPCHRVIGADGALRGYRWGIEKKAKLLELEKPADPKSP